MEAADAARAKKTCLSLAMAIESYFDEYSCLPETKATGKPVATDEELMDTYRE